MSLEAWTISYQGRSAREIVDILKKNGIEAVVHIGTTAEELEGSKLEEELNNELDRAKIEFSHLEGAGEPPEFRGIAADRGRDEISAAFNAYLSRRSDQMARLRKRLGERPTAILCYQRGERACEATLLVQLLQTEGERISNL